MSCDGRLFDRTRANVPGVHFYDEPGLTWIKGSPHLIPPQHRAYEAAFGQKAIPADQVDPGNPDSLERWFQWSKWKLAFMDSAWKEASFGVSYVRPDFLSITQSQYAWTAFTDGYYFTTARSLPVISGHGGYDDLSLRYMTPSQTLEMSRAREFLKPNWYLPLWYGNTTASRARLEQYLSFQVGIQGLMTPPDLDPARHLNSDTTAALVACNKIMARLGTIFTAMPVNRPPVAGLQPLTRWDLPADSSIEPATKSTQLPSPKIAWETAVPDSVAALSADAGKIQVLCHDGTLTTIDAGGKVTATALGGELSSALDQTALAAARKYVPPTHALKMAVPMGDLTAAGYWGGTLIVMTPTGQPRYQLQLPNGIDGMGICGGRLIVATADGKVLALECP